MLGLLIAWLMAGPDINIAFFWMLAGLASSSPAWQQSQPNIGKA
jgi:hypothetical protein